MSHTPLRTCCVTREKHPITQLIRFTKEGENILPNLVKKQKGRGVYILNKKTILEKALKQNIFAKGFKKQVKTTPELLNNVEQTQEALMLKEAENSAELQEILREIKQNNEDPLHIMQNPLHILQNKCKEPKNEFLLKTKYFNRYFQFKYR